MASIPTHCPTCTTEDGVWAYGRLVFDNDPVWPKCAICKGRLVPVLSSPPRDPRDYPQDGAKSTHRTSIVIDLTNVSQLIYSPSQAYASVGGTSPDKCSDAATVGLGTPPADSQK